MGAAMAMRRWRSKSRAAPALHLQSELMLLGYALAGDGSVDPDPRHDEAVLQRLSP